MSEQEGQDQNDVMSLLKRMQQQLAFLEKKMDTLIQQTAQTQQAPRRPFRPFGRPNRQGGFGANREGGSQGQGGFGRPQGQGGGHFKKKPFFGNRGNNNRGGGEDRGNR